MFSKFPSKDEETAAAALHLLASMPPPPFSLSFSCSSTSNVVSDAAFLGNCGSEEEEEDEGGELVDEASSFSSANVSDLSSILAYRGGLRRDPLLLLASAARLEVVREAVPRFKFLNINPKRKLRSVLSYRQPSQWESTSLLKEEANTSDGDDQDATSSTVTCSRTGSAVSSSSSFGSSNSRYFFRQLVCRDVAVSKRKGNLKKNKKKKKKKKKLLERIGGGRGVPTAPENWITKPSNGVRRQVEAIRGLLRGKGCASEVTIREVLGNSPDTSKALRILLKHQEVTRTGNGGRSDPFVYMVSGQFREMDSVWQTL